MLNIRVGRDFKFGDHTISLAFDVFNITNNGADQQFLSGGNQVFSANFARQEDGSFLGRNRQFARSAQLLIRYVF
jgi:hypothetical protein